MIFKYLFNPTDKRHPREWCVTHLEDLLDRGIMVEKWDIAQVFVASIKICAFGAVVVGILVVERLPPSPERLFAHTHDWLGSPSQNIVTAKRKCLVSPGRVMRR